MRKLIASFFILAALPFSCLAASQTLVNDPGLAYNNTYSQNLDAYGNPQTSVKNLSAQITYTSATIPSQTFEDGQKSTGSLTVTNNNGLVANKAIDHVTVAATNVITPAQATDFATVLSTIGLEGQVFTVNGNTLTEGIDWEGQSTTTGTAANLTAAINARISAVVATRASSVINMKAAVAGKAGNLFTLATSTPTALSVHAANFAGGHDSALLNTILTVNGIQYRNGYLWQTLDTSSGTATSIATLLGNIAGIDAHASGSVVFATASVANSAGNLFTIVSSTPTALTVLTPTFTTGRDNAVVSINGVGLTQGTDWNKSNTSSATAKSISDAIMANSTLNVVVHSTWTSGGVVLATSTMVGDAVNYTLLSSTPTALTWSGATMTGGDDSAYSLNSAVIALPTHGFTTALPVLYSGSPAIGGLSTGTTYYVVVVDPNDIELASTSTGAVAGVGIVITSSATPVTSDTYTLKPLTWTQGPASGKWQVSNDGTTWGDYTTTAFGVAVTSQTFVATNPATTVTQDFGQIDYSWIRYNVLGPTRGGINLQVILNAKD